jgi:glycosyltransferase involved in cell wall biosynthesis
MEAKSNPNEISGISPKKRVLFIVTQSELGGAQRFLCELISRLDRNKYEVLVAAGKDGDGEFLGILKNAGVPTLSLRFLRRKIGLYGDFKGYLEVRGLIRDFKPDTLFLSSSKAGVLGSLAARKFPHLKAIYRIGGWSFNDPMPWLVRRFYILAEKCTARFKDTIIVNNRHDLEQAERLKIRPRGSIELIYNGLDPYKLEIFGKDEAKIKLFEKLPQRQRGFLHAKIVVGTVANFYKTKGLGYFIEAIKLLRTEPVITHAAFVIIGDGPEKEKLELQIKESGMKNKIFLTGKLPDVRKYLAAFDIFVLPSVKEGFPWALLEAMAAKLPVIATNVGAAPEIIEDGKNGFMVEPRKPELIAQKIKELIGNERLRNELGIQAHQTVVLKFDLNKMVQQIEDLL